MWNNSSEFGGVKADISEELQGQFSDKQVFYFSIFLSRKRLYILKMLHDIYIKNKNKHTKKHLQQTCLLLMMAM